MTDVNDSSKNRLPATIGDMVKSGYVIDDFTVVGGHSNLTEVKVNPQQAIRRFCWECQGGHELPWRLGDGTTENQQRPTDEVRACRTTTCWLYPFRTGRNPYSKRLGNTKNLRQNAPNTGAKQAQNQSLAPRRGKVPVRGSKRLENELTLDGTT